MNIIKTFFPILIVGFLTSGCLTTTGYNNYDSLAKSYESRIEYLKLQRDVGQITHAEYEKLVNDLLIDYRKYIFDKEQYYRQTTYHTPDYSYPTYDKRTQNKIKAIQLLESTNSGPVGYINNGKIYKY